MLIAVMCFKTYWLGNIAYCEMLTVRYGDEFLPQIEYYLPPDAKPHVLKYTGTYAEVYFRTWYYGQKMIYLKNSDNNEWEVVEWECIWSLGGSADGFIWPYIR